MKFSEVLNNYLQELDCTAKDICKSSGISAAAFSRYRSGERTPDPESEIFENLCNAIAKIAEEKGVLGISRESVHEDFLNSDDGNSVDIKQLLKNFDTLVSILNININKLCHSINYDASTVFRFRNGSRKPAEPEKFAAAVAGYVAREMDSVQNRDILAALFVCEEKELFNESVRYEKLVEWLLSGKRVQNDSVSGFLNKIDEFDLNEYIKAIHFDELKVPSVPFQIPTSRYYFGLKEMMESEVDFLKATVLSKSKEPVTMYSNMPMKEMAKDPEFPQKWMFGMAMMLKKGLHLNQIHSIDRSFDEMMLGLESYIPMYMTGQISPYYLKHNQEGAFLQLLKVSGTAALSGEAIAGYHSDGRYYLTKSRKEVEYYSKRAEELLKSATPLMNIYNKDNANELNAFLVSDSESAGKRRSILSTLPLYTIDQELLKTILHRYEFADDEIHKISNSIDTKLKRMELILDTDNVEDEIYEISEEEFNKYPLRLDLSEFFREEDVLYTYEEYLEHLRSTEEFAKTHTNYMLKKTSAHAFRNLQIRIHEGKWAMISKGKAPAIHFVIHHPKLLNAIENFIPPVVKSDN